MGLLTVGTPLEWSDIKNYVDLIHEKGIIQFINLYKRFKNQKNDCLKWGDEIEYCLIKLDHENKKVKLLLKADELLPILQEPENNKENDLKALWRPDWLLDFSENYAATHVTTYMHCFGNLLHEFAELYGDVNMFNVEG